MNLSYDSTKQARERASVNQALNYFTGCLTVTVFKVMLINQFDIKHVPETNARQDKHGAASLVDERHLPVTEDKGMHIM